MFFILFAIMTIAAVFGARMGLDYYESRGTRLEAAEKKALRAKEKELTQRWDDLSWIGRQVMKTFNRLPEAHRPSYDIEAAVRALDIKYGLSRLDGHFEHTMGYYPYETILTLRCDCVYDHEDYASRADECYYHPEYVRMIDAMGEIEEALRDQERAHEERERQMVLAGIENDLNSVEAITKALRAERDLIYDVTKEIA